MISVIKHGLLTGLAIALSAPVAANCTGYGNFSTCYDAQSGNSYNVSRYGNTTTVQGYNSRTGNTWSQNSYRNGNTTSTYGTAADGGMWNSTTTDWGNGNTTTYGTDSNGNSFYKTCTQFGCY